MTLTVGSLFAGAGGFEIGLERAGMRTLWQVEIDEVAQSVLARHWPEVERHRDVRDVGAHNLAPVDVVVGGSPCQAFSVAGLRQSLSDDRGNLAFEFCRVVDELGPEWVIWENVPGVLRTADNAFGCILAALVGEDSPLIPVGGRWTNAGLVAGPARSAAWRILDAQYFGVPQRRRRIFVVAHSGDWRAPAEVLFEPESGGWHPPARRAAREAVAGTLGVGSKGSGPHGLDNEAIQTTPDVVEAVRVSTGNRGTDAPDHITFVPVTSAAVSSKWQKGTGGPSGDEHYNLIAHTLHSEDADASEDGPGRGTPLVPVAFSSKDYGHDASADVAPTLRAMNHVRSHLNGGGQIAVLQPPVTVRRLTPRECERLQGWPDDHTRWSADGREISDSARYRMIGNGVAAPVAEWLGQRIVAYVTAQQERGAT